MSLILSPLLLGSAFVTDVAISVIATLVGGGALAVITTFVARRRDTVKAKKEEEKTTGQLVTEMYRIMKGEEATPLNRNPPLGLVDKVDTAVSQLGVVAAKVETIEHTLTTNGFKQPGGKDTILDNLQQIRHNTKPDGGETKPQKMEDGTYDHS